MKPSGAKIIIKPRQGKGSSSAAAAAGTSKASAAQTPETDAARSAGEEEEGMESGAERPSEHDGDEGEKGEDEGDGAEGDEENDRDDGNEGEGDDEGDGDGVERAPVPRARGRPRGRGRGLGSATPRGRGRGRGRARGRGRGLTIKLPRRPDEEGAGEVEEGTTEEAPVAEEPVVEAPLGGGKPFRKIHGKVVIIENDEFITDEDEKGNTKIDAYGNLLGGRVFKAATFTLPNRHPHRVYMLAIDAARTSGFRDSLYYFRRNLLAFKLNATQPEKEHLIEAGKLGAHLKTRSVTLITTRSAFKLHGSKMVVDGKWVEDDYYEDKALEEATSKGFNAGDLVGDLPDPSMYTEANRLDAAGGKGGANIQGKGDRAGGGLGLYRAGGPTTIFGGSGWGPYSDGPLNAVRKSLLNRDGLNEENWIHIAAQRTVDAGEEFSKIRKEALQVCGGAQDMDVLPLWEDVKKKRERDGVEDGVVGGGKRRKRVRNLEDELPLGMYEAHSGIVHYRSDTQPTKSRWEVLPDSLERRVLGGTKSGNGAWALAWVDTVLELPSTEETEHEKAHDRDVLMGSVEGLSS